MKFIRSGKRSAPLAAFMLLLGVASLCGSCIGVAVADGSVSVTETPSTASASSTSVSPLPPVIKENMGEIQTDKTGQAWGIEYKEPKALNVLSQWDGTRWIPVPFPPGKELSPDALQLDQRGGVLCLWRTSGLSDTCAHLLSEHLGKTNQFLARWTGNRFHNICLYGTPSATWITEEGTEIWRVDAGTRKQVYTIKRQQMTRGYLDENTDGQNPLQVVEDSKGRTWFWSNELTSGFDLLSLRGLLQFDGKSWKYFPHLVGVPDKPHTIFQPYDANNFWLACGNAGLFMLDGNTLKATRLKEPILSAFHTIQKIDRLNGKLYLISYNPEQSETDGDYSQRTSDLWYWNEKPAPNASPLIPSSTADKPGHWQRLLHGIDKNISFNDFPTRPMVATAQGLWLSALDGGVWWVPTASSPTSTSLTKPVLIDWRRGLPVRSVNSLEVESTGRVMASRWGYIIPDLRQYLAIKPSLTPQVITSYGAMVEDSHHRIWRSPSLYQRTLQEWDGVKWTSHPIPTQFKPDNYYILFADFRGRIWLISSSLKGNVAFFDSASGIWTRFATFQEALVNQLKVLGPRQFALMKWSNDTSFTVRVIAPNRLTFRSSQKHIFYYDGHKWFHWLPSEITGKADSALYDEETPYFNNRGALCVNLGDSTWHLTSEGKWKSAERENYPYGGHIELELPAGIPIKNPQSIVRDSNKTLWFVKDQQLYKTMGTLYVPQFSATERSPFQDGRPLMQVLVDKQGNTFLQTNEDWEEEYFMLPRTPAPDTQLQILQNSDDGFTAHFSTTAPGPYWFQWRLDNGAWSKPTQEPNLTLSLLLSGTHHLEVQTMDSHLQFDPTPAIATLTVKTSNPLQIKKLLGLLQSPDYSQREMAVSALAKQPAFALPALREAREQAMANADTDLRWWIDAAIQQCEAGQQNAQTPK